MISEHAEMLMHHGIDYEDALHRFGGDVAMYEKFVFRFLNDAHKYQDLKEAMARGDADTAHRIAHALKGVVGNVSFGEYHEAIGAVDQALRVGDLAQARKLMPPVDKAHYQVMSALNELLCVSQN